jgi:hypothetical protein
MADISGPESAPNVAADDAEMIRGGNAMAYFGLSP